MQFLQVLLVYSAPMFGLKKRIFRTRKPANTAEDPPSYPPYMEGLPAATPARLLADHEELIKQIYQAVRASNEEYEKWYVPLMERFAAYVHLLPASEAHHHSGPGGLLRHGLEVAFWSMRQCENMVYGLDEIPEVRRQITLRWELSVFAGGLCHDIGKCSADMFVTNRTGDLVWPAYEETLYDWLTKNNIDRYFVSWRDVRHGRHDQMSAQVLGQVISPATKTYISGPRMGTGKNPFESMVSALNGSLSGGPENQVYTMINKADRSSTDYDLKTQSHEKGAVSKVTTPIVTTLLDTMRRLVRKKTWKVNSPGARLWFISGRFFLVWPACAEDITRQIDSDGFPGIPRHHATIADKLIERGLAIPCYNEEGEGIRRYWRIAPDMLQTGEELVSLKVLELANATSILEVVPPVVEGIIYDPENPPSADDDSSDQEENPTEGEASAPEVMDGSMPPEPVVTQENVPLPEEPLPPVDFKGVSEEQAKKKTKPVVAKGKKNKPKVTVADSSQVQLDLQDLFKVDFSDSEPVDLPLISEPVLATDNSEGDNSPTATLIIKEPANPDLFKANNSLSGEILEALAEDLKKGERKWQIDVQLTESNLVAIRYPEVLGTYGSEGKDILAGLKEQEWLEPDPDTLMNNCMSIDNFLSATGDKPVSRRAVVLTAEATETFLLLAGTSVDELQGLQGDRPAEPKQDSSAEDQKPRTSGKKRKRKPKRKKSAEANERKARQLAGGARIEEAQNPPPERTGLVAIMHQLLLSDELDVTWTENKLGKYAPEKKVLKSLLQAIKEREPLDVTQADLVGAFHDLKPDIALKRKNHIQQVLISKEATHG